MPFANAAYKFTSEPYIAKNIMILDIFCLNVPLTIFHRSLHPNLQMPEIDIFMIAVKFCPFDAQDRIYKVVKTRKNKHTP